MVRGTNPDGAGVRRSKGPPPIRHLDAGQLSAAEPIQSQLGAHPYVTFAILEQGLSDVCREALRLGESLRFRPSGPSTRGVQPKALDAQGAGHDPHRALSINHDLRLADARPRGHFVAAVC